MTKILKFIFRSFIKIKSFITWQIALPINTHFRYIIRDNGKLKKTHFFLVYTFHIPIYAINRVVLYTTPYDVSWCVVCISHIPYGRWTYFCFTDIIFFRCISGCIFFCCDYGHNLWSLQIKIWWIYADKSLGFFFFLILILWSNLHI